MRLQLPVVSLVLALLTGSVWAQDPAPVAATPPSMVELARQFSPTDLNGDGVEEIQRLSLIETGQGPPRPDSRLLLVLVEERLWQFDLEQPQNKLAEQLSRYAQALAQDGWSPVLLRASLDAGPVHQDGRSLLALRRFFQATRRAYPEFAGAILVGSFPESMLVRRWVWKHNSRSATLGGVTYNHGNGPRATFLALDPELISHRSDVVLCDLDGNWEDLYQQGPADLELLKFLPDESITGQAQWPVRSQLIETDKFSLETRSYQDFFFIDDADYEILERSPERLKLRCDYALRRPEIGPAETPAANPLAQPDILVSRINPRHVAVTLPPDCLDVSGKPQAVPREQGSPNSRFQRDPDLEYSLLLEYFDRNLAHRQGRTAQASQQVASLWTDLQTPSPGYFANVSRELGGMQNFPRANTVDLVRFLKTPAILKGISAHSSPHCSVLIPGYSQSELEVETGGNYWFWKASGNQFVPSYDDPEVRDRAHASLLRTLWENGQLQSAGPSFYIHGGCEAISPLQAATEPYHSPNYGGHQQIAESLMFFGNGLALIGRSKVFYDIPRGFDDAWGKDHGRFGDILSRYYQIEAADAQVGGDVAGRNRVYFWSILGDWTLRLNYPPGS